MGKEKKTAARTEAYKRDLMIVALFVVFIAAIIISVTCSEPASMATMAEQEQFCFAKTERRVYEGESIETELLNGENGTITLTADDESIAIVLNDGTVHGVGVGKTTIKASIAYTDTSETDTAVMTVEVLRKEVPSDSDLPYWYEDEIFLLNGDNPVGKDYIPELVNVRKSIPSAHKETKLTPDCEAALAQMYEDYLEQNLGTLRLISTYRSYEKQETLLNNAIKQRMSDYGMTKEEARAHALKTRMLPGHSEHQSGLAIDFSTDYTTQNNFHKSKQGKWLTENAHKYGFILRYPSDKVDITGINYEPWHFRFIETEHAVYHATYIYEHGLCLEEYIELQKQAKAAAEEYARNNPAEEE